MALYIKNVEELGSDTWFIFAITTTIIKEQLSFLIFHCLITISRNESAIKFVLVQKISQTFTSIFNWAATYP